MPYCLDSDVFIQAHRGYYAFDIVPGFWEALVDWAENGLISTPLPVYDELVPSSASQDVLAQWLKDNKSIMFVDVDQPIVDVYSNIANFVVERYEPQHVQLFLQGADPWVIACAYAHDITVVTMEKRKNETSNQRSGLISGRIKIPNVCEYFDVRCIDTFALLRELGRSFR